MVYKMSVQARAPKRFQQTSTANQPHIPTVVKERKRFQPRWLRNNGLAKIELFEVRLGKSQPSHLDAAALAAAAWVWAIVEDRSETSGARTAGRNASGPAGASLVLTAKGSHV